VHCGWQQPWPVTLNGASLALADRVGAGRKGLEPPFPHNAKAAQTVGEGTRPQGTRPPKTQEREQGLYFWAGALADLHPRRACRPLDDWVKTESAAETNAEAVTATWAVWESSGRRRRAK
jgi:hypothetical protein